MTVPIPTPQMPAAWFVFLLLAAVRPLIAVGDTAWTEAGTKNGIALAFRDDPALQVREVRATADLPFPAKQIFSVVCDFSQYRALVPGVQEVRLLGGQMPADYEVYLRYSPRFVVVAARDVAIRVQRRDDETGSLGCEWSELTDRIPLRSGTVRMPLLRGSWAIEARDTRKSRIVYQVAAKPGGSLPGWLVRRGSVNALADVIEQVKRCLERASTSQADVVSCRE